VSSEVPDAPATPFRVALTFDAEHPDRPHCPPGAADAVLDALAASGARATFFVQGRWASAYPTVAARIAADGHLVGSHSHYHAPMPSLSGKGFRADLRLAGSTIRRITGRDPRPWFRLPFLAGADDSAVSGALDEMGYRHIGQHVVVNDWEPDRDAADLVEAPVRGVLAHGDGAVVLLHTWPAQTAAAVTILMERLEARGARFVGIDDLDLLP
jgi:peptidoglycan/xylan/chitin deacetylase (PgdA/CDA1 family)